MTEEGLMTWEYRRILITSVCDCEPDTTDALIVIDGEGSIHCSNCDKKLKIEQVLLSGCPKCTKPKIKELNEIEKEFYKKGNPY
jgi:Zn finger protein HypA/HybF involved in hydrogenase expression